MNDKDFLQEIARKWVELGGDSEGVKYGWKRLQEAVIEIEFARELEEYADRSKSAPC